MTERRTTGTRSGFDELRNQQKGPKQIAPPELERIGAGYRLTFPEVHVEIHVSRVHWHREDAVAVYTISILPTVAGQPIRRIDHGNLNLMSSRTRATLANQLTRRYEAGWEEILEQASRTILDLEVMGEDPTDLGAVNVSELPAPELLGTLALLEEMTMLFGQEGDGKSLVGLAAMISIATGRALLDLEPTQTFPVGILDWEWDYREHARRIRRLVGDDVGPGLIHHFPCRRPIWQEVDRLSAQFRRLGIRHVLVDSVAWACGGAPEESERAVLFQNAVKQLEVGALCIAHINRTGDTERPFGSIFWAASMRTTWFIKKQQEVGEDTINVGLFNRKANGGRKERPFAFTITFSPDTTTIVKASAKDVPELRAQLSLRERIVALLQENGGRPMTYSELAKELNVATAQIRARVKDAKQLTTLAPDPSDAKKERRVALSDESRTGGVRDPYTPADAPSASARTQPGERDEVSPGGVRAAREREETPVRDDPNACPHCGFGESRPLADPGARLCLGCERIWHWGD